MAALYILKSLRSAHPIFSCLSCKNLLAVERFAVADSHFPLQNLSFCRPVTTKISAEQDDYTVSYLVNSCGLSPESAIQVAQKVKLRSLEKADAVLALLRNHEFSNADISKLVKRHPLVLMADAEKTLLPKLEFFCSTGISRMDLARTLSYDPALLKISLQNQIIPAYNYLKSLLLSEDKVMKVLKNKPWIFLENLSKNVVPNIELLRELGMPSSGIALLLAHSPNILMKKHELFSEIVGEVKELGFEPMKSSFVSAIRVLSGKKTIWSRNSEAYRKWGWSEDDILSAFKLNPLCMTKSEKKIMKTMEFLVNKMGWPSASIAKYPTVVSLSLERRIIPRCSVVKVLFSKGLMVEENLSLASVLCPAEKPFLERFVIRYLDQVPQLSNVYQGKVDIHDIYD
ncbi:PREDICTED: mRNAion termination factor [Prunus dulcis]|uniref:PREDICTED: mRNAion termination factor n=1 Tax=Prunus dulcis TaxID=3755 RepID=A0A5E4EEK7_PRUDU|nr:transcription termination factor MTERF15, mitochondrial-like [Prunus dulcis]VVA14124.1 PREDICTED: mRNAion termination factor [Prunus dulcis]